MELLLEAAIERKPTHAGWGRCNAGHRLSRCFQPVRSCGLFHVCDRIESLAARAVRTGSTPFLWRIRRPALPAGYSIRVTALSGTTTVEGGEPWETNPGSDFRLSTRSPNEG